MLGVQHDQNNDRMGNTILVQITTNLKRIDEPTQVMIDIETKEGKQTGLLSNSAITCENLYTTEQTTIVKTLGNLPNSLMEKVDDALRASLGL